MAPNRSESPGSRSNRGLAVVSVVVVALLIGTVAAGAGLSISNVYASYGAAPGPTGLQQVAPSGFSGTTNASDADATLSGLAENDTAGWSVASGGGLNGDGVEDLVVGAPRHDRG